jgi:hypothetical protein
MINAAALAIASFPLGLYLLLLGAINLRRRPLVVSGTTDVIALALGVAGLVAVGPLNLFLPEAATVRFGPFVWALSVSFYILCVVLYLLLARPRLVVFNVSRKQLWTVLEQVVRRLDSDATLAGDAVHLPQLGVQFHLEEMSGMRNLTLVATGDRQSISHWKRLHQELAAALREQAVEPNPRGFTFCTVGLFLIGWPLVQLLQMPSKAVAQQFWDMLRL